MEQWEYTHTSSWYTGGLVPYYSMLHEGDGTVALATYSTIQCTSLAGAVQSLIHVHVHVHVHVHCSMLHESMRWWGISCRETGRCAVCYALPCCSSGTFPNPSGWL